MRRTRSVATAFVFATAASVVGPRVASAQQVPEFSPRVALDPYESGARAPNELQATDAFERGTALAAANRFHEAALAFEESYAAIPRPSTLFDIAQTYRASGESMRAIGAYRRYLALGTMSPARRVVVNATIAELEHRLANVTVRTTPVNAAVTIDGVAIASAASVPLDPGRHVLAVQAAGRAPMTEVFRLREHENRDFVIALDRRPLVRQAWFWGLMGAVVASAALTTAAVVIVTRPEEPPACSTLSVCVSPQ